MKKTFTLFVLSLMAFISIHAQQYLGGEIWWDCLSNGRFAFHLYLYKSCGSEAFPDSILLHSSSPAGDMMLHIYPNNINGITDLTPICNADTNLPHIICDSISTAGAVLRAHYTTDQNFPNGVILNGVPPASGYQFYVDECCRDTTDNLIGTGHLYLVSKMFNYNNQNTYPCFDDAPLNVFPSSFTVCSNDLESHCLIAKDLELDNVFYEWDAVISDSGNLCTYQTGFGAQNPFGDTVLMNMNTAEIKFDSLSPGKYAFSYKIYFYKGGFLYGEIHRELILSVISCAPNHPPYIAAPFINLQTGLYTEYTDTIYVGEYVSIPISASDFDTLFSGLQQSITMDAFSMIFGSNNSTTGCYNPPCATLTTPLPITSLSTISDTLNWQTECYHLYLVCHGLQISKDFDFIFSVSDDNCPLPATQMAGIHLVLMVMPQSSLQAHIRCITADSAGNVKIIIDSIADPFGKFREHKVYVSNSASGPFQLHDSITNPNQTVYTDFTANAANQPLYYYLHTFSNCGIATSGHTDTIRPIFLELSHTWNYQIQLNWNATQLQLNPQWYRIYRKQNPGNWVLLDSTQNLNYVDTSFHLPDSLFYRIVTGDSNTCLSSSAIFNIFPQYAGIDENNLQKAPKLLLYPNPAKEFINIAFTDLHKQYALISISDIYGKLVFSNNLQLDKIQINISDLSPGTYHIKVVTNNTTYIQQFVISR